LLALVAGVDRAGMVPDVNERRKRLIKTNKQAKTTYCKTEQKRKQGQPAIKKKKNKIKERTTIHNTQPQRKNLIN
jgi:hypothetical protein